MEKIVCINGELGIVIVIVLKEGVNFIELGQLVDEKIVGYNCELFVGFFVVRMVGQDLYVD